MTQTPAASLYAWSEAVCVPEGAAPAAIAQAVRLPATTHFPGLVVQASSYARLVRPTRWLNDEIILAGMSSLLQRYPRRANSVCALSSYEISRWRDGASVRDLHRHVAPVAPWARDILVIPINENNVHWTAAIVYPEHGLIEVFDSLANETRMREQAQVCDASSDAARSGTYTPLGGHALHRVDRLATVPT